MLLRGHRRQGTLTQKQELSGISVAYLMKAQAAAPQAPVVLEARFASTLVVLAKLTVCRAQAAARIAQPQVRQKTTDAFSSACHEMPHQSRNASGTGHLTSCMLTLCWAAKQCRHAHIISTDLSKGNAVPAEVSPLQPKARDWKDGWIRLFCCASP